MTKSNSKIRLIRPIEPILPPPCHGEEQIGLLPFAEIRSRVCEAIAMFYEHDSYLMAASVHERSMTFRLGMYLQQLFPLWNVDCEYNKNSKTIKDNKLLYVRCNHSHKLDCAHCSDQRGCTVFPDIIIHKRETEDNLLVIEAKKKASGNSEEDDIEKIKAYLDEETLKYKYGLFIDFKNSACETIEQSQWFPEYIVTDTPKNKETK